MKDGFGNGAEVGGHGRHLIQADSYAILPQLRDRYASLAFASDKQDVGDNLAVSLRCYLYMFLKRKWLILGIIFVFFGLAGIKALLQTPLYKATVRIQIEREAAKIVEGGVSSTDEGRGDLKTQVEVLKSRNLAERVVSLLHLSEDDAFFKPSDNGLLGVLRGAFSSSGKQLPLPAAREQWASQIVAGNVSVMPVAGSRLLDISYTDPSPARAQQVANGYADAYVASAIDKRFEANAYAKTFLEDQIKQLKLRLEDSEKALLDFAEREKTVEVGDKTSIAENNLASASVSASQLISERIKTEQLWRQVENTAAINLPQFLSNSVV